jgi:anti-sigma-K factor RskA
VSDGGRFSAPRPDCRLDAAPYVLGALEPVQARAFARHLERCAACRDEVAALAPVLDVLPVPEPPGPVRPALRRRVLRAVRDEPKRRTPAARRVALRRSVPTGWLALGAAVAAALIVQLGSPRPRVRAIRASVGRAELRVSGGHGELVAEQLPPLPAEETYELWLQSGRQSPAPSTLFAATSRGQADLGVPGDLDGLSRLLVTVEPRGGSLVPTTRAVIQVPLNYVRRS